MGSSSERRHSLCSAAATAHGPGHLHRHRRCTSGRRHAARHRAGRRWGNPDGGPSRRRGWVERLTDALVGAGVALVFSQLLFSPQPLALLRRAERAVLKKLAAGLALTASALEQDDDDLAERAIAELRDLPDDVTELRRSRRASGRVVRRTVWRSQRALVVRESENADQLDFPTGSCLSARAFRSLTDVTGTALGRAERADPH